MNANFEYLAKPFFQRGGLTIVDGLEGTGKSMLALDLAWRLSKGKSVFGKYKVENPVKVFYLQGDMSMAGFRERKYAMGIEQTPNFISACKDAIEKTNCENEKFTFDNKKGLAVLEWLITEFEIDILVIDSLVSFIMGNMSEQEYMSPIMNALKQIANKHNTHIFMLTHSNKQHDVHGSKVMNWAAAMRATISAKDGKSFFRAKKNQTDNVLPKFSFAILPRWNKKTGEIRNKVVESREIPMFKLKYFHNDQEDMAASLMVQKIKEAPQSIKDQAIRMIRAGDNQEKVKKALGTSKASYHRYKKEIQDEKENG